MKKLYTKYVDEKTGITGKISKEKIFLKTSSNDKEFVFRNSNVLLNFVKLSKKE